MEKIPTAEEFWYGRPAGEAPEECLMRFAELHRSAALRMHRLEAKWLRGANRYNNGATRYGKKYLIRYVMGLATNIKQEDPKIREERKA